MRKKIVMFRVVLLITLLAGWLRIYAARNLYGDDDESTYMTTSVGYASMLRHGDYNAVINYDLTSEHPSLYKILFGAALLIRGPIDTFSNSQLPMDGSIMKSDAAVWIITDRYVSVVMGTLTAAVFGVVNPWAGFFLGIHALDIKYTSEVYLEALPMFTSLLCVITYLHWFRGISVNIDDQHKNQHMWLAASAFFLGLTAAGKYIYCVAGIAILVHFTLSLIQRQIPLRYLTFMIVWAIAGVAVFFVFNPYLWPDPIERLSQSIQYHLNYSRSEHVLKSQYPFWQPFRWLFSFSRFYELGPRSAFIFDVDTPIFLLAMLGLPRLFQQNRFYFYWLMTALIFLLIWNTKWPQYALIALIPLCVAASEGMVTAKNLGRKFLSFSEDQAS